MRLRVPLFAVLLLLGTVPGWAAGTWYDHYLDARDKHIPQKRWDAAHASLKEAIRLKPESALQEQTYGLTFVDYLPYYWLGVVYFNQGDYDSALRFFAIEETKGDGAIRRSREFRDLLKKRAEAE